MRWSDLSQFQIYWETSLVMMLSRLSIVCICLGVVQFLIIVQPYTRAAQVPSPPPNIYTQQAVTQVQVTQQAADIAKLQADLDTERTTTNSLRDDLATVRGIGIGAAAVIGLLQTLQMILQVKAVKKG